MPKEPRAIVLDSWAVIAYLEDEDAAARVADIIADAHDEQIPLLMTVVNAGGVGTSSLDKHPPRMPTQVLSSYASLGLNLLTLIGV